MEVLITGAGGQVGRELTRRNWPKNATVRCFSHRELDITDPTAVRDKLRPQVDLVVNAAAYTAVDRAQSEPALAYRINALGTELLACRCHELKIPLIHLSTDYVFDGSSDMPYVEDDEPSPLNVYGASKLAGEAAVRRTLDTHLIIRTASVFSEFGQNFVRSMLRLGRERSFVNVVADQQSCPTAAADLAEFIVVLAQGISSHKTKFPWGVYHFSGQPPVTWFHFAQQIFELASDLGIATPEVRPIAATGYSAAASRPSYSALDCSKAARTFGVPCPSWSTGLRNVIDLISTSP